MATMEQHDPLACTLAPLLNWNSLRDRLDHIIDHLRTMLGDDVREHAAFPVLLVWVTRLAEQDGDRPAVPALHGTHPHASLDTYPLHDDQVHEIGRGSRRERVCKARE